MRNRAHLYVVAAAASPVAASVIPITVASRERSWRDLVRRLEKNPLESVVVPTTWAGGVRRHRALFAAGITSDHPTERNRK